MISTSWPSIASLAELNSDRHAWFMQAYEAQFLEPNASAHFDLDELIASQMNVITTAHWLQQHIQRHYAFDSKQTFCVISGLDKTLWKPMPREPLSGRRRVRFLLEGPIIDPRKNVARTLRLLEELCVPYRWVGSAMDPTLVGPNCLGVDQQVPYQQMPRVYASTDVLVKASNSEGMFGPPPGDVRHWRHRRGLDVQGAEEYMSDRYNSYLVPMNSGSRLTEAICELSNAPDRIRLLQENALATAEA